MLPFYAWTRDSSEVLFTTVNRDHTVLRLMAYDPLRKRSRTLVVETDPTFIDEDFYAAPVMLPDGEHYLWLSERDGWMHLYLYSLRYGLRSKLTDGDWTIETTPYGLLTAGRPVYVDPAGRGPTSAPRSRARWSDRSTAWTSAPASSSSSPPPPASTSRRSRATAVTWWTSGRRPTRRRSRTS